MGKHSSFPSGFEEYGIASLLLVQNVLVILEMKMQYWQGHPMSLLDARFYMNHANTSLHMASQILLFQTQPYVTGISSNRWVQGPQQSPQPQI